MVFIRKPGSRGVLRPRFPTFTPSEGGGASPVFDGITAYALFGVQKLRSTYSGPLVKLRRASDNAEQDFYPANGYLSRNAVIAWAGSGVVVRVKTLYDQSGNGYDASQSTAANQPYLDLSSSTPAVFFDNTVPTSLPLASGALTFARNQASLSAAAVASADGAIAPSSYDIVGIMAGSVDAQFSVRVQNGSPAKWAVFARRVNGAGFGLPTSAVTGDDTGWHSLIGEADFTNNVSAISVDGTRTTATTNTAGNTEDADPVSVPTIGASKTANNNPFKGFLRAAALFRNGLSSGDRATINTALGYLRPATSPNGYVAAWGDSLTSAGYPAVLATSFDAYRFVYNGGVGSETAAQIRARQVADAAYNQRINLLWAGRNGFKTLTPAEIIADIDLMIAHVSGGRYLVFSPLPSTLDSGAEAALLVTLNAALATAYGARFIDMVAAMQAANDGSANDLADVAAGYTPRSLRSDELHPNSAGNTVIAARANTAILANSW